MGNKKNSSKKGKSKIGKDDPDSINPPVNTDFRMTKKNQQSHRQPLYCVTWSNDKHADENGNQYHYLATCGSRQLTIYEIESENPKYGRFEAKQIYKDQEKDEHFYACAYGGRSTYWGSICLDDDSSSSRSDDGDDDEEYGARLEGGKKNEIDIDNINDNRRDRKPPASSLPADALSSYQKSSSRKRQRDSDKEESSDRQSSSNETLILESESQGSMNYMGLKKKPYSSRGPQLLCVAGASAVIKVVDPVQRCQLTTLQGHGSDVYDLKVSPSNEFLLLSASVDESIRLWNLQSFSCVAIFAGHHGHRESILSISWHPLGQKFASAGMDKSIRLWKISEPQIAEAIQASQTSESAGLSRSSFHPVCAQFPYFATTKVHLNFVDCVQFVGDLLLSKSTYNTIVLWMAKVPAGTDTASTKCAAYTPPSDVIALRTFILDNCNLWFVRFAADSMGRMLAVGNIEGKIDIWDIGMFFFCEFGWNSSFSSHIIASVFTLSFLKFLI